MMAVERLAFGYSFQRDRPVHTVEFTRLREVFGRVIEDDEHKRYEVTVDGRKAGYVEQVTVSTSRSPRTSPIRWGIGHHLEWGWTRYPTDSDPEHRHNYPGLYGATRREAVSDMLGYGRGDVERLPGSAI